MTNQLTIEHDEAPAQAGAVTSRSSMTPMEMIAHAIETGRDIAIVEKLMDLQERWERNQGRKAFDNAIASAKAEIPVIEKKRRVDYKHRQGDGRTSYMHEDLATIAEVVDPILGRHGLSYRFKTHNPINEPIRVTCVLSHRDGYSEENSLVAGADNSGQKNSIQAIASTVSYLMRYTLKAALGLAASTSGDDDDGQASSQEELITEDQVAKLIEMAESVGLDRKRILTRYNVERLDCLPAKIFNEVFNGIVAFGAQQKEKQ